MPSDEYYKNYVKTVYADAVCYRVGVMKYEIRRKRRSTDGPGVVPYMIISEMKDTPERAWKDAGTRIFVKVGSQPKSLEAE